MEFIRDHKATVAYLILASLVALGFLLQYRDREDRRESDAQITFQVAQNQIELAYVACKEANVSRAGLRDILDRIANPNPFDPNLIDANREPALKAIVALLIYGKADMAAALFDKVGDAIGAPPPVATTRRTPGSGSAGPRPWTAWRSSARASRATAATTAASRSRTPCCK